MSHFQTWILTNLLISNLFLDYQYQLLFLYGGVWRCLPTSVEASPTPPMIALITMRHPERMHIFLGKGQHISQGFPR